MSLGGSSADLPVPATGQGVYSFNRKNPGAMKSAMDTINKLKAMDVRLVSAINPVPGPITLIESPDNITLPLPLKFSASIADPSSYTATANGTYNQAQIQALMDQVTALTATVTSLTTQLTLTGQNP